MKILVICVKFYIITYFILHSACTTLAIAQDRLRLGIKNKQACFVLLSACTTLAIAQDRLRLGIKNK